MTVRLGTNPIAWSNDDLPELGGDTPLRTCLAEAREAGFTGIEKGNKFPSDPAALRDVLGRHGLAFVSGWYGAELRFLAISECETGHVDKGAELVLSAFTLAGSDRSEREMQRTLAVAAYVLSASGSSSGRLRVIYRSQRLTRAFVRVSRGALIVLTADYARGDDVCCPAARLQRTYVWDRRTRTFRRTATRRLVRTP